MQWIPWELHSLFQFLCFFSWPPQKPSVCCKWPEALLCGFLCLQIKKTLSGTPGSSASQFSSACVPYCWGWTPHFRCSEPVLEVTTEEQLHRSNRKLRTMQDKMALSSGGSLPSMCSLKSHSIASFSATLATRATAAKSNCVFTGLERTSSSAGGETRVREVKITFRNFGTLTISNFKR